MTPVIPFVVVAISQQQAAHPINLAIMFVPFVGMCVCVCVATAAILLVVTTLQRRAVVPVNCITVRVPIAVMLFVIQ